MTKALQGDAKRKYFQHAGALLTADGSDDHLIKLDLEGAPSGYNNSSSNFREKKIRDGLVRSGGEG